MRNEKITNPKIDFKSLISIFPVSDFPFPISHFSKYSTVVTTRTVLSI